MCARTATLRPLLLLIHALLAIALLQACSSGDDPIENARRLFQAGNIEGGLETLRDALAEAPDDAALNLAYGRALISAGQPSLSVWSLAKAGESEEHTIEAWTLLARAQIRIGSLNEARATLESVLEREPDHLEALRLKVEALVEARQPELALETAELALDLTPDDLAMLMSRMRIFLTLDYGDDAAAALADIRQRMGEIEELAPPQRRYLSGRYCAIEAMFTHENGDSEAARSLFAECLEEHPLHPQVVTSSVDFFDQIDETENATKIFQDALAGNPADLSLRVALATRLTSLGDPEGAEALLLEMADEQPALWTALVDHYVGLDDRPNALIALDHAMAAIQGEVPAEWKLMRADLLIQTGRFEEAEAAIGQITENVYASTARGRLELARGNPGKALRLLDEGIRLWPDGTMARYLAAQAAEQLGDFKRAESEYREAYRSDQSYTTAGLELAKLLASRGLKHDAAHLAAAYAVANPDDFEGYEKTVEYALDARNGEMARSTLVVYQRHPALRSKSTSFAARYLLRTAGAEDALAMIDSSGLDFDDASSIEAFRTRCAALIDMEQAERALQDIDTLLGRSPDRMELRELKARILRSQGRQNEATQIYESVLIDDPDHVETLVGLADLESNAGRVQRAIELYDRAASNDPDERAAAFSSAMLVQSTAEREARLRRVLRIEPRHGEAAAELFRILSARGEATSQEALDFAKRARRFGNDVSSGLPTDGVRVDAEEAESEASPSGES